MSYKESVKKQVEQSITELTYHYNTLKSLTPISRYKDVDKVGSIIVNLHRVVMNISSCSKNEIYNQVVFLLGEIGLYADKMRNKDITTSVKLFRAKQALICAIKENF